MSTTPTSTNTVVAYFSSESAAEKAVDQLRDAGFTANQIGIASRSSSTEAGYPGAGQGVDPAGVDPVATGNLAANRTENTYDRSADATAHTAGAKAESAWDKVRNFFTGHEAEPYADERARGDFASHEVTTGNEYSNEDFRHSLGGLSVPEDRSRYFGHRFGQGDQGTVVTVSAPGREAEAEKIFTENGGDLGNNAGNYNYSDETNQLSGNQRIQLLGEVLRVHKDRISRGEVRIRKEVITETQTVEVPVTREELVIERAAPTDPHSATGRVGEGSEIRIPLTEEVASADKDTVVREEVEVGKRAVQSVANVGDNVSREELVVEDSTKNANPERRSA